MQGLAMCDRRLSKPIAFFPVEDAPWCVPTLLWFNVLPLCEGSFEADAPWGVHTLLW